MCGLEGLHRKTDAAYRERSYISEDSADAAHKLRVGTDESQDGAAQTTVAVEDRVFSWTEEREKRRREKSLLEKRERELTGGSGTLLACPCFSDSTCSKGLRTVETRRPQPSYLRANTCPARHEVTVMQVFG